MKLFIVTICHMDRHIIQNSLQRFITTNMLPPDVTEWVWVDNCYPLDKEKTSTYITKVFYDLIVSVPAALIKPEKNLGGHGGVNFALDHLRINSNISADDLILIYDPDSVPEKPGWLQALTDVMKADDKIAYLSLTHEAIKGNFKDLPTETIAGHRVITCKLDMFNITMFRAGFLMSEGMLANSTFYGHVETPLHQKCVREGLKHGYLADWFELENPIPHPKEYTDWKRLHASNQFKGNFDEYVESLKIIV